MCATANLKEKRQANVRYASACRAVRQIQLVSRMKEVDSAAPHDKLKHIGHLLVASP
jgi:hypothetical protein